jgi:hypothetical protein
VKFIVHIHQSPKRDFNWAIARADKIEAMRHEAAAQLDSIEHGPIKVHKIAFLENITLT